MSSNRPKRAAAKVASEKITAILKPAKKIKVNYKEVRLEREMNEFADATYSTEFKAIERVDNDIIIVQMKDNSLWSISRSLNYFEPPIVTFLRDKTGIPINTAIEQFNCCWTPALSSAKWFLMLYDELYGEKLPAVVAERTVADAPLEDADMTAVNVINSIYMNGNDADYELSVESMRISDDDDVDEDDL